MMHIAVSHAVSPLKVVDVIHLLQIHRNTLGTIGDFAGNRIERNPADFLEVRKLRNLHAVEPDFPSQPPGAERGGLPVILHKPDVVFFGVDPQLFQTLQIEPLDIVGGRLQDHLILVVVLHAVGIFAVSTIGRPAAGLRIGGTPGLRTEHPQKSGGVHRAGADLGVVRLPNQAPLPRPVDLEFENDRLKI